MSFNPNAAGGTGATTGGFGGIGGLNVFGFHASLPRIKRRQPKSDIRSSVSKVDDDDKDFDEPKDKERKLDPQAVFTYVFFIILHTNRMEKKNSQKSILNLCPPKLPSTKK